MENSTLQPHCGASNFSTSGLPNDEPLPRSSPLLRLPLELRRMIYRHGLPSHTLPRDKALAIYQEDLPHVRFDQPSTFLLLNKQIHSEFCNIMQKSLVSLRITGQGVAWTEFGLSACIAQDIRGDLSKISRLHVGIWPPHPDRPIESLYIWNHLRRLRDKLRSYPQIQILALEFSDRADSTWLKDGRIRQDLSWGCNLPNFETNDLITFLAVFTTVTNVQKALFAFSPAIAKSEARDCQMLRFFAVRTALTMQGSASLARDLTSKYFGSSDIIYTWPENFEWEILEKEFKRDIAGGALFKLNQVTDYGKRKLPEAKYDALVKRWPYFEALTRYEDRKFMGKWHYVKAGTKQDEELPSK
ncbi:MAG: hypothetical protein Q9213_000278 [Squamulea squamosa]